MNTKILLTSLALIATVSFSTQAFVASSCQITSGPIPELAQYQRSVETRIAELVKAGKATCGSTPLVGNAMSAVSVIDRVFSQATVSPSIISDTFLDFLYNIRTTISGDARPPVTRDGNIFIQIDAQINSGLASVTRSCNLESTTEAGFVGLLRENHTLENIFKQAAMGTPTAPSGLSDKNLLIAKAINTGYIPTATEACETTQGKSFDEVITKLTQLVEGNGVKNE